MKPNQPKPELYTIRVPCALHTSGQHDIVLQYTFRKRVSFLNACSAAAADAFERLSEGSSKTCRTSIKLLNMAIKERFVDDSDRELSRCGMCGTLVSPTAGRCPFGRGHFLTLVPAWMRIVREGRVKTSSATSTRRQLAR